MNFQNLYKRENISIVVILVIMVFLFDFITKCFLAYNIEGFKRYSALPKILIEIGAFVLIIRNGIKDKRIVTYALILISISIVSTIIFLDQLSQDDIYFKLYNLNKYLFLSFFVTAFLSFKTETRKKIIIQIRNTVIIIGIINGLIMIFGWLCHHEILQSYDSERFGYNGFLLKTSEASYLYILLIITTYYDYSRNNTNGILCLYFILVSFLIGTKAVWLFVGLLVLIHFLRHKNKLIRYVFASTVSIGLLIISLFNDHIIKWIIGLFSFGPKLYEEHGFVTVISSTRDLLLMNAGNHLKEQGTLAVYLFGGIDLKSFGVEFEFIDLFLFFGLIGLIVYILLIKSIFFQTRLGEQKILLFLALMSVAFFAGNFFMSIICSIFAFVVFQHMDYSYKGEIK